MTKPTGIDSTSLKAITLEPSESIIFQGAPNLGHSIWHCYRILFNITWVFFVLAAIYAYFKYQIPMLLLEISFGIYMVILFLLSLIDAYTDRDVYYCITNSRVIKLKGKKIEKQLRFEEITRITHRQKYGAGFFLFSGGPDGMTVISVLGIERVQAIYFALPQELKKIADAQNSALIQ
ncbi:MAG: hypothetical protein IPG59_01140 [Candidatus Melainabacteria bacterium]|nr:MAG: hypothetical protein IPG59_01140 [Candidatus Melainabacteria bacterium]